MNFAVSRALRPSHCPECCPAWTDAIPGSLSFTFVEPILSGFTTVDSSYDAATLVLDGLEAQGATLMREPVRF